MTTDTTQLPPDPEGMNDARAEWAREALEAFMAATGTDAEDALSDLLCDLRHLCDREGETFGDFDGQLERSARCYAEEVEPFDDEEAAA